MDSEFDLPLVDVAESIAWVWETPSTHHRRSRREREARAS